MKETAIYEQQRETTRKERREEKKEREEREKKREGYVKARITGFLRPHASCNSRVGQYLYRQ